MQVGIRFVRRDPRRHRSAVETFAANRRAPMMLSIQDAPEGTLIILFIKPRPTLTLLAALLVLGYVGGGLGLAWWFERKPHNRIHAADIMLPWRWSNLRDLRGQMFCAQGLEALRQEQYAHGIFLVRRGLATHPNDAAARQALAETMAKIRSYEGVRDAVWPQLAFPPVPRPLLALLVTEATRADDPATIVECGERLVTKPANAADHQWLQLRRAHALIMLRRPEEALRVLDDPTFKFSGDAAELRVNALCALHRGDEAIALADDLPRAHAGEPQRRLRLLARGQREAGRKEELAATLAALIALDPASTESRLYAIEQFWGAGMRAEAQRELDALLARVSAQRGGISTIVQRLRDDLAPELLRRCVEVARAQGQPLEALLTSLTLACIQTADWGGAEEAYAALLSARRTPSEQELRERAFLRAAIEAGRQGTPRASSELKEALETDPYAFNTYVRVGEGLARADRWETVQLVTEVGLRRFRRSATLQRLAAEAREKLAQPGRVTPTADAPPPVPRGPDLGKFDAASFTARVKEHLAREEWNAAAELINAARRTEPPWFNSVAPELDWQDAQVAFARNDRLRTIQMIAFALKWPRRDVERALGFARAYRAAGEREAELAVVRKALEIVPDSAAAQRYLAELEGKEPPRNP